MPRARVAAVPVVRTPPDTTGLVVGAVCAAAMTTPSLVPRDWVLQGLVSGLFGAVGYGIGGGVARLLRVPRRPPGRTVLPVLAGVGLVAVLVESAGWQRRTAELNGMPGPSTLAWSCAGPLLVVVAVALVLAARAVAGWARRADRWLRRQEPRRGGRLALGAALVVVGLVAVPLPQPFAPDLTASGVAMPASATRSGSPASLVPWDTLGREGQRFVAGGPSAATIARVREPVAAPIRAFAGLRSAPTARARAALAVAELERTGGFGRPALLVMTTTGTGWVNGSGVDAVEEMYGGDTATVATQYSSLPSWISFVLDRPRAADEGRALWDAVRERVDRMPVAQRPRLLAGGESLGTLGSESAFRSSDDLRAGVDGAVWVGPTHANPLWPGLSARRDPDVRFAPSRSGLGPPEPAPRFAYLQHPSDPVVWWSPALLWRPWERPTGPGTDVHPGATWVPVLTFLQTTVDLIGSKSVPHGHGHNYDDLIPAAWAAVAPPEGWTAADTDRLLAADRPGE